MEKSEQLRRFDARSRLSNLVKTGAGGYRIEGLLGRTGVQEYRRADGSVVREYRSSEEVFNPDSLASLASIPVTIGHPSGGVSPETYKVLSVGHVSDLPTARKTVDNQEWIVANTVVSDARTQADIDEEKLQELSLGYHVDLVFEQGVTPDGQHYDARQTNIRYNHLALLPRGSARAGRNARLTFDGHESPEQPTENNMVVAEQPKVVVKMVTFDGKEYEQGSQDHVSALVERIARADKREGELEGKIATLESELEKASDASVMASRIDSEISFRDEARKLLGSDYKFDGKTQAAVRVDAVAKVMPKVSLDGRSEDFVAGLYESCLENAAQVTQTAETHEDSIEKTDAEDAHAKHLAKMDSLFEASFKEIK